MTENWRKFLVKESLSEMILEQIAGKVDENILLRLRSITCTTKEEIKSLENVIRDVKSTLCPDLYRSMVEELHEIKEDNRWVGSKRGKYILEINTWVQPFHSEFNNIEAFKGVVIGGHAKKEVVFVTGKVLTTSHYEKLLQYIQSKHPPFKVLAQVVINENT